MKQMGQGSAEGAGCASRKPKKGADSDRGGGGRRGRAAIRQLARSTRAQPGEASSQYSTQSTAAEQKWSSSIKGHKRWVGARVQRPPARRNTQAGRPSGSRRSCPRASRARAVGCLLSLGCLLLGLGLGDQAHILQDRHCRRGGRGAQQAGAGQRVARSGRPHSGVKWYAAAAGLQICDTMAAVRLELRLVRPGRAPGAAAWRQ